MIVLFRFQTVVRINASFLQGRRHKISAASGTDSGDYLLQNFPSNKNVVDIKSKREYTPTRCDNVTASLRSHRPYLYRQFNEVIDKFVFGFVSGFIGYGMAGRAAPLLARRRAVAAGQIAFD